MTRDGRDDAMLIRADHICLGYGTHRLTCPLSFEISRGDFWAIVGANGAGKTTLIKSLIGVQEPLSGVVTRCDGPGNLVGYVPQRVDRIGTLPTTIVEMVGLAAPKKAAKTAVSDALEDVGLGGREHRSFWALSGGEMRRALIARALVRSPSVIIFDEPAAGLDEGGAQQISDLMIDLNTTRGIAAVLVTHDLRLAYTCASHAVLVDGDSSTAGDIGQVMTDTRLRAAFDLPETWSISG